MDREKDRLGDKLRDIEHAREDKFFADRDRELLEKLRQESAPGCPVCGGRLEAIEDPPVRLLECPQKHGWWLGRGDVDPSDEGARAALARLLAGLGAR
jgi:hypothetical protein